MRLPDEVVKYDNHRVAFARYDDLWYKVIAMYGGDNIIVSPHPIDPTLVDHLGCRKGCSKIQFLLKNGVLRKTGKDSSLGAPSRESVLTFNVPKSAVFVLLGIFLGFLLSFGFSSSDPKFSGTPSLVLVSDLPEGFHPLQWRKEQVRSKSKLLGSQTQRRPFHPQMRGIP